MSERKSLDIIFAFIAITTSFFIVFFISHFSLIFFPSYFSMIQRISFIIVALIFMSFFRYFVFNDYKIDLSFAFIVIFLSLYSNFIEKSLSFLIDTILLAPLTEEFFFRGFMIGLIFEYANFEKNVLVKTVAIMSSIIVSLCGFTLMHPPDNFFHALYYGFLFSVIMIADRSIYFSRISNFAVIFPMIPHLLNNFFNVNNLLINNNLGNFIIFLIILILIISWSLILYKNINRFLNVINRYERRFLGARI